MRHLIRLVESQTSEADTLASLKRQRDALMLRWREIEKNKPDSTFGLSGEAARANVAASNAFWNDPEQGKLWNLQIYPLNQQIEALEASLKQQARVKSLQAKNRDHGDFATSEILYHGTDANFDNFDRAMARTAAHIYTSPDLATAQTYGRHVYAVYGRQNPQADLTAETSDGRLVQRIHRMGGFKREWAMSAAGLAEIIFGGELYSHTASSRLQDAVIDTCYALRFRSVRISDGIPGGGYSDSVIFQHGTDLQIVEQLS